jgi:hypothetical protein
MNEGAKMVSDGTVLGGGCLCGAMRYKLSGPSLFVSQCACTDRHARDLYQ